MTMSPAVDQLAKLRNGLFGDASGGQHDPYRARLVLQRLHHPLQRDGALRTLLAESLHSRRVGVPHHRGVPRLHQAARDVRAHPAKPDHANLHFGPPSLSRATSGL